MVFASQINVARDLINEFGQSVVWRCFSGYSIDPEKPWEAGSGSFTDHTVKVVFFPENRENYRVHQTTGDVQEGHEKIYLTVDTFTPTLQDIIIRAGHTYTVRYIDRLNPNGEQILYTVGVQR